MNTAPTLSYWLQLGGVVALQSILVIACAAGAARRLQSGRGQRAVWLATFVALALLLAGAVSGVPFRLASHPARDLPPKRQIVVTAGSDAAAKPISVAPPSAVNAAATAPAAAAVASSGWPGALWLAGFVALSLRAAVARLVLAGCCGRLREVDDAALLERVARIGQRIRLRRLPRVVILNKLASPIAHGVWRPLIGLPGDFTREFSATQQDAMLAHELAHVAARDSVAQMGATLVTAALWWCPPVWWARRQLFAASERAADEASLFVEHGPSALAECLVALGQRMSQSPEPDGLGMAGAGFRSGLGRRVERLLQLDSHSVVRPRRRGLALGLGVGACGVISLAVWGVGCLAPETLRHEPCLVAFAQQALDNHLPTPASPASSVAPSTPVADTLTSAATGAASSSATTAPKTQPALRPATSPTSAAVANAGSGSTNSPAWPFAFTPNVLIEVKLVEMEERAATALNLDRLIQPLQPGTNTSLLLTGPAVTNLARGSAALLGLKSESGVQFVDTPSQLGVLTRSQFGPLTKRLEKQPGVDLISAPRVITLSGRQAQVSVTSQRAVALGPQAPRTAGAPEATNNVVSLPTGISVDLTADLAENGYRFRLAVLASITDFLGYAKEFSADPTVARPRFNVLQLPADARVYSGQTLVLAFPANTNAPAWRTENDSRQPSPPKRLMAFVTPSVTDPAGNPVYADVALPFDPETVPSQVGE